MTTIDRAAAEEADRLRAYFAMQGARELANLCIAHGLKLRELHAPDLAEEFEREAARWREAEQKAAHRAGVGSEL